MKLVFYIHSLEGGGAERVVSLLANHWAARGWDVTVITLSPVGTDFYPLLPTIRRVVIGRHGAAAGPLSGLLANLKRVLALRRELAHIGPDVAISMIETANVILACAAIWLPQVLVIGSERVHPPHHAIGRIWSALRRWTYGRLHCVVAQSELTAAWLRRETNARRVRIIPNPVEDPVSIAHRPDGGPTPAPVGRKRILAVGRLRRQKGFDLLLEAFARIAAAFDSWDLVIVGDGPERAELARLAASNHLDARVYFPGATRRIVEWYEQADLYVLSSRFEGFPNTLLEAMAHGLPAIAFDCETGPG
ncbi:MAG: glycosyltransferase family 4 protein, partial [Kofleriaceae bacterium]